MPASEDPPSSAPPPSPPPPYRTNCGPTNGRPVGVGDPMLPSAIGILIGEEGEGEKQGATRGARSPHTPLDMPVGVAFKVDREDRDDPSDDGSDPDALIQLWRLTFKGIASDAPGLWVLVDRRFVEVDDWREMKAMRARG